MRSCLCGVRSLACVGTGRERGARGGITLDGFASGRLPRKSDRSPHSTRATKCWSQSKAKRAPRRSAGSSFATASMTTGRRHFPRRPQSPLTHAATCSWPKGITICTHAAAPIRWIANKRTRRTASHSFPLHLHFGGFLHFSNMASLLQLQTEKSFLGVRKNIYRHEMIDLQGSVLDERNNGHACA